ncbi:Uncharacterised protein [Amycolatopsis camponoti]|uniref:Uncharacterized protein n=1 Tax=Amycolatopsis camponoti TaxID=2606593 RepID=A0A6I8M742_9PSEU|nr:hypothetical protein [Amycolatopsis camponoti]VVJ24651.1 Uncharacterised protein [Amycolatopsis camponoti]
MPSPETDELATVPLPTGAPEVERPSAGTDAAEARAGSRKQAEPLAAEAGPAEAQQTERLATGSGPAEARSRQTEWLATEPGARVVPQETEPFAAGPGPAEAQTVPQERVEPERVEPSDAAPESDAEEPAEPGKPGGRWWRGFTGSLAAGLTVLAIGVLVVAAIDLNTGAPGPGAVLLVGHPVAAVLALLAQRVADRRNGAPAVGAGVAVVLFTVSALTLFWLT